MKHHGAGMNASGSAATTPMRAGARPFASSTLKPSNTAAKLDGSASRPRRYATLDGRLGSSASAMKLKPSCGGGDVASTTPAALASVRSTTSMGGFKLAAAPLPTAPGRMQTYVRIKPTTTSGFHTGMGSFSTSPTAACVTMLTDAGQSKVAASAGMGSSTITGGAPAVASKEYSVTGVFGPATSQATVYDSTLAPIVPFLFEGQNACCALYGMTGSGKTHTFCGPAACDDAGEGLMQRVLHDIFTRCMVLTAPDEGTPSTTSTAVHLEFVEVYADAVYDLLAFAQAMADAPTNHKGARDAYLESKYAACKRTLRDGGSDVSIRDAVRVGVSSTEEAMSVLMPALAARTSATTGMNEHSSRSHAILRVHVTVTAPSGGPGGREATKTALLSLVDLAGSERQRHTAAEGITLTQAGSINKSLLALTDCLKRMVDAQKVRNSGGATMIPWRASTLTQLLRPCLDGGAHASFIIALNPSPVHWHEAIASLEFAARTGQIVVRPVTNPSLAAAGGGGDAAARIAQLEAQLAAAQRALLAAGSSGEEGQWVTTSVAGSAAVGDVAKSIDFNATSAGATSLTVLDASSPTRTGTSGGVVTSPDVRRTVRELRLAVRTLHTMKGPLAAMAEQLDSAIAAATAGAQSTAAAGATGGGGDHGACFARIASLMVSAEEQALVLDRLKAYEMVASLQAAGAVTAPPAGGVGDKRLRCEMVGGGVDARAGGDKVIHGRRLRRRLSEEHWDVDRGSGGEEREGAAMEVEPTMTLNTVGGKGADAEAEAWREAEMAAAVAAKVAEVQESLREKVAEWMATFARSMHTAAPAPDPAPTGARVTAVAATLVPGLRPSLSQAQKAWHLIASNTTVQDAAATMESVLSAWKEARKMLAATASHRDDLQQKVSALTQELEHTRRQWTMAVAPPPPTSAPSMLDGEDDNVDTMDGSAGDLDGAPSMAYLDGAEAEGGGYALPASRLSLEDLVSFKVPTTATGGPGGTMLSRSSTSSGVEGGVGTGGGVAAAAQRRERRLAAKPMGAPGAGGSHALPLTTSSTVAVHSASASGTTGRVSTIPAAAWLADRAPVDPFYRPKHAAAEEAPASEPAPTAEETRVNDASVASANGSVVESALVSEAPVAATPHALDTSCLEATGVEMFSTPASPDNAENVMGGEASNTSCAVSAAATKPALVGVAVAKARRPLRALIAPSSTGPVGI